MLLQIMLMGLLGLPVGLGCDVEQLPTICARDLAFHHFQPVRASVFGNVARHSHLSGRMV